jgi:hypothetical protein
MITPNLGVTFFVGRRYMMESNITNQINEVQSWFLIREYNTMITSCINCVKSDSIGLYVCEILDDIKNDKRLENINAIVFLSLKQKGRGKQMNCLYPEKFNILIDKCLSLGISFGMDSCSGNKFANYCEQNKKQEYLKYVTGCESTLQSFYCNENTTNR